MGGDCGIVGCFDGMTWGGGTVGWEDVSMVGWRDDDGGMVGRWDDYGRLKYLEFDCK